MKKSVSMILSILLIFSICIVTYANEPIGFDAVGLIMGDVNFDGKINTKDARLVLRIVAKLEKKELSRNSYDTDGNGKLSTIDARNILRYTAKLSSFTTGFGADYAPNIVNAIKAGSYSVAFTESGTDLEFTVFEHNKFLLKFPYELFSDESMSVEQVKNMMKLVCSFVPEYMLVMDSKIYFTGTETDEDTGKAIPIIIDATKIMQGEDLSFFDELDVFSVYGDFEQNEINLIKDDDTDEYGKIIQFSQIERNQDYISLYLTQFGELVAIESGSFHNPKSYLELKYFNGQIDENLFSLSYYTFVE